MSDHMTTKTGVVGKTLKSHTDTDEQENDGVMAIMEIERSFPYRDDFEMGKRGRLLLGLV